MEKITFTSALNGYMLAAGARRLSQDTLRDYTTTFHKFLDFINQVPPIDEITSEEVKAFLASKDQISKKTLLNYHIGLSALWTWCVDEDIVLEHIVRRLR